MAVLILFCVKSVSVVVVGVAVVVVVVVIVVCHDQHLVLSTSNRPTVFFSAPVAVLSKNCYSSR